MKKIILTTILSSLYFVTISQTNNDVTIKKIKTFLLQYKKDLNTGKAGAKPSVFYNKAENILDIDNFQVPIDEVKTTYFLTDTKDHCVSFDCKYGHCIASSDDQKLTGFMVPFISKQSCYDFISLINQLKK